MRWVNGVTMIAILACDRRVAALLRWTVREWKTAVVKKTEREQLVQRLRKREAVDASR